METTRFGGVVGQVVSQFVSKSTLISAIPVIVFVGILSFITMYIFGDTLEIIVMPLITVIFAFPIARFAIPARMGYSDEGFLSAYASWNESFQYSLRYAVANLVWILPVIIAGLVLGLSSTGSNSQYNSNPFFNMTTGSGILLVILMIFSMLGPLLALLVTTATEEISELFDKDLWLSFITSYREELIVFCVNVIGAVFMFWLLFSIPLLIITAIAFMIAEGLGFILLGFMGMLPLAISPIILGRLAGSLIYSLEQEELSEEEIIEDSMTNDTKLKNASYQQAKPKASDSSITTNASDSDKETIKDAPSNSVEFTAINTEQEKSELDSTQVVQSTTTETSQEQTQSNSISNTANPHGSKLKLIEQKLTNIDSLKKNNAIFLAQNAQKTTPDEPYHFAEEVLIHCQFEEFEQALPLANRAIPKAINFGDHALVFKLFSALGNHRVKLKLAPPVILRLKQSLLELGHYLMAVQAILILVKMQPEEQAHKEMILDIAFKAQQAKSIEQSKKIYAFFIKKYADNPLVSVAQKGLSELNS
jgi:tetratricopeptide (TPR) repeat protein